MKKDERAGIVKPFRKTTGKHRGYIQMDPAGFMVGLIGIAIGILLSYIFEKRHILGKKGES
jgi:hypothetical protein